MKRLPALVEVGGIANSRLVFANGPQRAPAGPCLVELSVSQNPKLCDFFMPLLFNAALSVISNRPVPAAMHSK